MMLFVGLANHADTKGQHTHELRLESQFFSVYFHTAVERLHCASMEAGSRVVPGGNVSAAFFCPEFAE